MARNDVVLLDGILRERTAAALPSNDVAEVFEYFAFEQILKNFDVDFEEIEAGWVDGSNDGGIDGFYIFVNGHLLTDLDDIVWPKRNPHVDIVIVTCKHEAAYAQATLNTLHASLAELFDFSRSPDELSNMYSDAILGQRTLLVEAYRKLSSARPRIDFHFYYASRGEAEAVAPNISGRATQIVALTQECFSSCRAAFTFLGAKELIELSRAEKNFCLDLPYQELLTTDNSSFVVLVRLNDYRKFLSDESGGVRRYLFDSNVRDYLDATVVNEEIGRTLADKSSPDFWWLNNGVTILGTMAQAAPGKVLQISDVQIVNGLQTSESIYKFFASGGGDCADRVVLVKVIVSTDPAVRDKIIRATNSQNAVEHASLRATDKIQRDIEAALERQGWFYERRKNYYKIAGQPQKRFVTPLYAAAAFTNLVLKKPYRAVSLRSRFMRNDESYREIFAEYVAIETWVSVVEVTKKVDDWLSRSREEIGHSGERFVATWRHLLAFLAVARVSGSFRFGIKELNKIDLGLIDDALLKRLWDEIIQPEVTDRPLRKSLTSSKRFVHACCSRSAEVFGLKDAEWYCNREASKQPARTVVDLSDELINAVLRALPPQPWKPGMRREVLSRLGITGHAFTAAVERLIELGKVHRQKDGVVYAADGSVLFRDPER